MSASRIALLVAAISLLLLLVASQVGYLPRTVGLIAAGVAVVLFLVLSFGGNRRP